ncbi:unnamed protein product [Nippostrongylus brasiliensis]|uniref:Secreted protein n=1 Tax=Nippostrongylus brasiliensis TaxID=27835 RepID=A0A0N4XE13_NIPBR|nr:unnamed protein product [Nippostrongylus brasiliensis]
MFSPPWMSSMDYLVHFQGTAIVTSSPFQASFSVSVHTSCCFEDDLSLQASSLEMLLDGTFCRLLRYSTEPSPSEMRSGLLCYALLPLTPHCPRQKCSADVLIRFGVRAMPS